MLNQLVAGPNQQPTCDSREVGEDLFSSAEASGDSSPKPQAAAPAVCAMDSYLPDWAPGVGGVAMDLIGASRPAGVARSIVDFERTPSLFTKPSQEELEGWRHFLMDFQTAAQLRDSAASAQAMREVLADNPQIFAWFAASRNLADLVDYYPALTEGSKWSAKELRRYDEVGSQLWDACRVLGLGRAVWEEVAQAKELFSGIHENGVGGMLEPRAAAATVGRKLWSYGQAQVVKALREKVVGCVADKIENLTRQERVTVLGYVPDSPFLAIRSHIA